MQNVVELASILGITLISIVAIGSSGGSSCVATKAIETLKSAVDTVVVKLNRK